MTTISSRRGARALVIAPVLACGLFVSACGTTVIDDKKVEKSIRSKLTGNAVVKNVDCPSGVKPKKGDTFDCTVNYTNSPKATVTIHMDDSKGHISFQPSDFHQGT